MPVPCRRRPASPALRRKRRSPSQPRR